MTAYVGNDEERAIKWIEHEDPKRLFISVYDLTKEAIKSFNVSDIDGRTDKEYSDYRQLCMVKHSNPLIQMQHGYLIEGNNVLATNGRSIQKHRLGLVGLLLRSLLTMCLFH